MKISIAFWESSYLEISFSRVAWKLCSMSQRQLCASPEHGVKCVLHSASCNIWERSLNVECGLWNSADCWPLHVSDSQDTLLRHNFFSETSQGTTIVAVTLRKTVHGLTCCCSKLLRGVEDCASSSLCLYSHLRLSPSRLAVLANEHANGRGLYIFIEVTTNIGVPYGYILLQKIQHRCRTHGPCRFSSSFESVFLKRLLHIRKLTEQYSAYFFSPSCLHDVIDLFKLCLLQNCT